MEKSLQGLQELTERVRRALDDLRQEGIGGWGLSIQADPSIVALGRYVQTGPAEGCTSETCGHVSHDPADAHYRWVPAEGQLVHLGGQTVDNETEEDYYVLLHPDGLYAFIRVAPRGRHVRVYEVDPGVLPAWALARLAE